MNYIPYYLGTFFFSRYPSVALARNCNKIDRVLGRANTRVGFPTQKYTISSHVRVCSHRGPHGRGLRAAVGPVQKHILPLEEWPCNARWRQAADHVSYTMRTQ